MALFGKRGAPSNISTQDRLLMAAAALGGDTGAALQYRMGLREFELAQEEKRRQLDLAQQAAEVISGTPRMGPAAPVTNADGMDISDAFSPRSPVQMGRAPVDPRHAAAELAKLQALGLKGVDNFARLAEMAAPKAFNANGRVLDERDPSIYGGYYGEAPTKGAEPVYDRQGREIGWRMADGSLAAIGASREAEELGKLRGSSMPVPTGDGGTQLMLGADWLAQQGGGQGGGRMGYTPPAAQLSADKIRADAGAQAQVDLPNNLATAQSTLEVIRQLRDHPGRRFGTGATGVIPAIPGTSQKDFVTLLEQARGKTFLEAFSSLKGGGQITEREGQAAQSAIARLDRAQSEEGFLQALDELEQIVTRGAQRAQQRAGAGRRPAAQPSRSAVEAELRRRGLIPQ